MDVDERVRERAKKYAENDPYERDAAFYIGDLCDRYTKPELKLIFSFWELFIYRKKHQRKFQELCELLGVEMAA